jgi:hypothetical protein
MDVIVRSRGVELVEKILAMPQGSKPLTGLRLTPRPLPADPGPTKAPSGTASPERAPGDAVPPERAPGAPKAMPASPLPGKLRNDIPARPREDPRAKTMGLIQIYQVKGGRCQLAHRYYLPPGDHIINVDGGRSRTVSVNAGATVPIRDCP